MYPALGKFSPFGRYALHDKNMQTNLILGSSNILSFLILNKKELPPLSLCTASILP